MDRKQIILNDVVKKHKEVKHYILPSLPLNDNTNKSYFVIHHWMASVLNLTGTELMLYAIIFNFCNTTGKVCYCSRKAFASYINTTDVTITSAIKKLEEKKLIIVDRHLTSSNINENYYLVNIEILFKALSKYDVNIDFIELTDTNDNLFDLQLDKLYLLASEYNEIKNADNNENDEKSLSNISNEDNNINEGVVKNFNGVVNNFNDPIKNFNTNNIINNIYDNIEDTHSINTMCIYPEISDVDNTSTNTEGINQNINTDTTDTGCFKEEENIDYNNGVVKSFNQKQIKNVFKLDSKKANNKLTAKQKKSKRDKEKQDMYNLIKEKFLNEVVDEPELVDTLNDYLDFRLSLKNNASLYTYKVWAKQIDLLIDISEGDYDYAKDIVLQAYLGQYKVLCFSNQKKSQQYGFKNNNKKMSYQLDMSEETIELSKAEKEERRKALDKKAARDRVGNTIKF